MLYHCHLPRCSASESNGGFRKRRHPEARARNNALGADSSAIKGDDISQALLEILHARLLVMTESLARVITSEGTSIRRGKYMPVRRIPCSCWHGPRCRRPARHGRLKAAGLLYTEPKNRRIWT